MRHPMYSEIDKMDKELAELEKLKAIEEDRNYGLTEIDIMYFLHHLKKGNIDDPDYRKLLVNVLVNSVYLYEDDNRATIIFNASNQTPVKVDVSLLDEIKEKSGSYASSSSPPKSKPVEKAEIAFTAGFVIMVFRRKFILSNMTHCCRVCYVMIEIKGRDTL